MDLRRLFRTRLHVGPEINCNPDFARPEKPSEGIQKPAGTQSERLPSWGFPPSLGLPLVLLQKVGKETLFFTTPPAGGAVVFGGLIVFLGLLPQQKAACHFKIQNQLIVAEESVAWILGQGSR